jgi:hypothetical protein
MSSHDLTLYIITGLGSTGGFLASLILNWLRSDVRALAEKITSLDTKFNDHSEAFNELKGILKGKGIIRIDD